MKCTAALEGFRTDLSYSLINVDRSSGILALFEHAVLSRKTVHSDSGKVAHHGFDKLIHIVGGAVMCIGEKDLECGRNLCIIKIYGVKSLLILSCDNDLHTAEGGCHR